jgi:hypothetical protein
MRLRHLISSCDPAFRVGEDVIRKVEVGHVSDLWFWVVSA